MDRLELNSCFLLAGRAWQVVVIHHNDRLISVQPAAWGIEPSWGGFAPQFLTAELCGEIRAVLKDTAEPSYLHPGVVPHLRERRAQFAEIMERPGGIVWEPGDIRWWTFAGGRINTTLQFALRDLGDWKVTADNFTVRVRSEATAHGEFMAARRMLREPGFWSDAGRWSGLELPSWRLSKFQRAMPERAQHEMLSRFLLDLEGTAHFLGVET
ncbi:MAG: ATP-dependent Lhr-like helicase [Myxococcota bacterium]